MDNAISHTQSGSLVIGAKPLQIFHYFKICIRLILLPFMVLLIVSVLTTIFGINDLLYARLDQISTWVVKFLLLSPIIATPLWFFKGSLVEEWVFDPAKRTIHNVSGIFRTRNIYHIGEWSEVESIFFATLRYTVPSGRYLGATNLVELDTVCIQLKGRGIEPIFHIKGWDEKQKDVVLDCLSELLDLKITVLDQQTIDWKRDMSHDLVGNETPSKIKIIAYIFVPLLLAIYFVGMYVIKQDSLTDIQF